MRITNWVQVFFVHKKIISAAKKVEFVSERMLFMIVVIIIVVTCVIPLF
jgi:hypothetical protein